MRHLLTLLILAASAFGQTATISDTIRTPFNGTFSGTVTVSLNSPALAQPLYSGNVTLSGWTQTVTVTAGVFTLTLYTNDLITPGGTSYTATYAPTSGSGWKETWVVPTGATTIREIRSTTVPSPSVRFTPSQITQAGATLGQGLKWDGSKWAPADVVANPMTTNGDLITRLGGVPVRVGIGSTNQVLTVSGGMPVWASGITGNASTATALAANGTNCSAGSFPLGVDASGNAEGCTAAVTASTGLSDSSALVRNNQANTYTAGLKQTFASNATTAGAAFGGGITADPSSVTAGDFWYRADLGTFGFRNATAVDALVAGGRALTTVGSVPFVTAAGVLGQSANFRFFSGTGNLVVGTTTDDGTNRLQVAGGARLGGFTLDNGAAFGASDPIIVNSGVASVSTNFAFTQNALGQTVFNGSVIDFRTASVQRARFTATSGNLLLGTTTDGGFKLDVADSGSSGGLRVWDQRATTGSTSLVVRAGAGQTGNLQTWQNSAGAGIANVDSLGRINSQVGFLINTSTGAVLSPFAGTLGSFARGFAVGWGDASDAAVHASGYLFRGTTGTTTDLALSRFAAGRLELNSGTAIGTTPGNARDIMARGFYAAETTSDPSAADLTIAGSNTQDVAAIYVKNDKLVVAYNRSGTVNYLTIPLDGATTTFTQSTTAP